MWWLKTLIGILLISMVVGFLTSLVVGPGFWQRHTTLGGVYVVLRPDGYDVACFGDSSHGVINCIPCTLINSCKRQ